MYGPLTVADLFKMLWWVLTDPKTHPNPPTPPLPATVPSSTLAEVKRDLDRSPLNPLLVVPAADHSYRRVRPVATTAILCEQPGRKATLHEDHYPSEEPGKGFDKVEGMKLTRVNVMLVE